MTKTHLNWREAHAWLRGYSDALEGRGANVPPAWAELEFHYQRGYSVGTERAELRAALAA